MNLYVGAAVVLLTLAGTVVKGAAAPTPYDEIMEESARRWLPMWDWRWLKAQMYQESLYNPNARSPVGAQGIAQFMPATWREVSAALRYESAVSPLVAEKAIGAAAYYDAKLRAQWKAERSEDDRRRLTFACYNAGCGNIARAQRVCIQKTSLKCVEWFIVSEHLPAVTGRHARETRGYIVGIERWYGEMTL